MPDGYGGQRNGLNTHIAGTVIETGRGEDPYFWHSKAFGVVGMEGADKLPAFSVLRDIIVDGLWEENPREGEIEEVELDLMHTFTMAEVDNGIESVTIEAEPRMAVVKYACFTVGETLRTSCIVLAVGLVKKGCGLVKC